MDYVPLLKRLRMKYPHATEEELWHGVAVDCYIRSGHVPREVELAQAAARARALLLKYRVDQPRVPAGVREGGQWTQDIGLVGTPSNLNPQVPKLTGQKPSPEAEARIRVVGRGDSDIDYWARKLRIDPNDFSDALHALKEYYGLRGADNVIIKSGGDVHFQGRKLDNIRNFLK